LEQIWPVNRNRAAFWAFLCKFSLRGLTEPEGGRFILAPVENLVLANVEENAVKSPVLAIQRFVRDDSGATAIEYAIIAGSIFLFIVMGVQLFGNQLGELFQSVTSGIATVAGS
jgi:pilus assembly protein Flp/PilA